MFFIRQKVGYNNHTKIGNYHSNAQLSHKKLPYMIWPYLPIAPIERASTVVLIVCLRADSIITATLDLSTTPITG